MFTSGWPTNAALLKITKGSSGPATKLFQKIGKARATPSFATTVVGAVLWLHVNMAITPSDAASSSDNAATATTQLRGKVTGLTASGCPSDRASCAPL